MEEENQLNWIDAMIKRQATPKALREGSVDDFCKKYNVTSSTYYYQFGKKENHNKIVKASLLLAKNYTPDILKKLGQKAKEGDTKAIDMFLNYILKLSANLDIKSDGKRIGLFDYEDRQNDSNPENPDNDKKD